MHRKQKNIQEKYWIEKGFDSSKEFLIYQFLCENLKFGFKRKKVDKSMQYYRYDPWREHIENILNNYENNDLEEFYHFVRLRKRKCDISFGMHTSMFIPLIVALVAGILAPFTLDFIICMSDSISNISELKIFLIVLVVATIALTLGLIHIFDITLSPYINSKSRLHFWTDCMEIVEDKIKTVKAHGEFPMSGMKNQHKN